ncbi:precorrin-4 C11-methyltransferase [Chamaesiphon minutus PCC 6605]|uniref:Precorrin-4 C11-methyltransferase n=1 Tax=Chamaesiphon minutus (strain ATCC 27169 / PCC 6605) TaxID=1173020 RepID=K9UA26_CHAP6|nr:precorrin-4 C(11)-methyltransferase [Chamaesiphon minutus]AFY91468.1 precorrin-4 C11-methyltransferase [Chamaesiphon minutus PCC 6605]
MIADRPLTPQVYIIGVGPGDPDLLTVKGQRIIATADTILYADSLIPDRILQHARPDAEIIKTSDLTLEQIVSVILDRVSTPQGDRGRSGLTIARLHSGDLSLYSAISEQIHALKAANITVELIPGISAYQAAAATLQVELTIPEIVQTIILTRPSGRASSVPPAEDLASLAAHQSSLCLYLAARHVETAQSQLLCHYPPETLVAICFRVGWEDERIWVVPLTEMAERTTREGLVRTTMYIISPALAQIDATNSDLTPTRSRLYHPQHQHLFRSSSDLE